MYKKYFLMLTASFITMYVVMYLHTYEAGHVFFSATRLYMTFLMICPMALIMLGFMHKMYKNKQINAAIVIAFIAVFSLSLVFVRSQTFIGDVHYMKGMIPHHSIAILTSKRAKITDPEVRELADKIIKAQEEEIAQMKELIKKLEN
ncbi:MAG: DUF305 domain-containing protein [Bacteroidales bacterium]